MISAADLRLAQSAKQQEPSKPTAYQIECGEWQVKLDRAIEAAMNTIQAMMLELPPTTTSMDFRFTEWEHEMDTMQRCVLRDLPERLQTMGYVVTPKSTMYTAGYGSSMHKNWITIKW